MGFDYILVSINEAKHNNACPNKLPPSTTQTKHTNLHISESVSVNITFLETDFKVCYSAVT